MDKLFINGLELWMRLGCTPEERAFPQRLLVDIEMEVPLRSAGTKDDMQHTVDYAEVVGRLKGSVEPKVYKLVETVAEDVAQTVLKKFHVKKVMVRVRKRVLPSIDNFGVEIRRP
jgi:FolB domain-containing protein